MSLNPSVFVIAEAGVNHNGDAGRALEMIDAAAAAKADAVKFQTFDATKLVTTRARKAQYQLRTTGDADGSQLQMLRKLELPLSAYASLVRRSESAGIEFLSTPFDEESVDLLASLGVRRLKVGSGDITNAPLLLKVARSGLPVIVSTGASTLADVERALGVLAFGLLASQAASPSSEAFEEALASPQAHHQLASRVTLLHCVSEYPAPVSDVNLLAMDSLREAFGVPVGYSDHTMGIAVALAACARGASTLEKHFTLDRSLPGPDHGASLDPSELTLLVRSVREVSSCLGRKVKMPAASEIANRTIIRRSVVASKPIPRGTPLTRDNVTVKRPAGGRSPFGLWDILGKAAERDFDTDEDV